MNVHMRYIHSSLFSLEKYGKIGRFSRRLRPDWGNNAWAATDRLGSIGLNPSRFDETQVDYTNTFFVLVFSFCRAFLDG